MNDNRRDDGFGGGEYSRAAFEAVRSDVPQLARLNRQLTNAITERLRSTILEAMEELIAELNSQGHELRPMVDASSGEISFRDDGSTQSPAAGLRVAHDSVVSVGFADFDPH